MKSRPLAVIHGSNLPSLAVNQGKGERRHGGKGRHKGGKHALPLRTQKGHHTYDCAAEYEMEYEGLELHCLSNYNHPAFPSFARRG